MRPIAYVVPLLGLLAACNTTEAEQPTAAVVAQAPLPPPTAPTPAIVKSIQDTAAKSFKDPYSAKWDRMQRAMRPNVRGEPTDVVCGYVNAKNSYGAYTGAKPFLFFVERPALHVSGADDQLGVVPSMLKTFCTGLI